MKEEKIKVVVVYPEKPVPVETEILNSLKGMQAVVGGYVERVWHNGFEIFCNEEGKLDGLPLNRPLYSEEGEMVEVLAGTFFISAGDEDGELRSLTEDEIRQAYALFTMTQEKAKQFAVGLSKMGIKAEIIVE